MKKIIIISVIIIVVLVILIGVVNVLGICPVEYNQSYIPVVPSRSVTVICKIVNFLTKFH